MTIAIRAETLIVAVAARMRAPANVVDAWLAIWSVPVVDFRPTNTTVPRTVRDTAPSAPLRADIVAEVRAVGLSVETMPLPPAVNAMAARPATVIVLDFANTVEPPNSVEARPVAVSTPVTFLRPLDAVDARPSACNVPSAPLRPNAAIVVRDDTPIVDDTVWIADPLNAVDARAATPTVDTVVRCPVNAVAAFAATETAPSAPRCAASATDARVAAVSAPVTVFRPARVTLERAVALSVLEIARLPVNRDAEWAVATKLPAAVFCPANAVDAFAETAIVDEMAGAPPPVSMISMPSISHAVAVGAVSPIVCAPIAVVASLCQDPTVANVPDVK